MPQDLAESRKIRSTVFGFLALLGIAMILVMPLLINSISAKNELTSHLENVKKVTSDIIYYDEVLTNSARNYIADTHLKWKSKYHRASDALDTSLVFAQRLDPQITEAVQDLSETNNQLVAIEKQSFQLVENNQHQQAQEILYNQHYIKLKQQYMGYVKQALQNAKIEAQQHLIQQKEHRLHILVVLFTILAISFITLLFYLFKHFNHTDTVINKLMLSLEEKLQESELNAKKLDKANNSKSLFLANMSHEIRTPMNGIHGNLQLLLDRTSEPDSLELVNGALRSSQMLTMIVNDILDFTKIEANKLEIESLPFSIDDIITDVQLVFERECQKQGLEFKMDNQLSNSFWLGDALRLKQIFWNVLSNAVKFTEQGGVSCTLSQALDELTITITDTGIGMSDNQQQSLFTKFEQADVSTTRKYGGTGLGMSIVKELVAKMAGKVAVTSSLGEGTTVVIKLPLTEVTEHEVSLESAPSAELFDFSGNHILVAEDNKVNQAVVNAMLKHVGCEVTIVETGQQALDRLTKGDIDLVFMDIHMPEMDGVEACKRLKQRGDQVKIIALTASVLKEDLEHYNDIGFDAVVAKPIDKNTLYKTMATFI